MSYIIDKALFSAYTNIIKDSQSTLDHRVKAVRLLGEHLGNPNVQEFLCFVATPVQEEYPEEVMAAAIKALEPLVQENKDIFLQIKRMATSPKPLVRVAAAEIFSKNADDNDWEWLFGRLLLDANNDSVWSNDKDLLMDIMELRWKEKQRHENLDAILADLKKYLV